MQVLVVGSVLTARSQEPQLSPDLIDEPRPISRKLLGLLCTAVALPIVLASLLLVFPHAHFIDLTGPMGNEFDPNLQVRVGKEARKQLLFHSFHRPEPGSDRDMLPDATFGNFWAYEDGSWNRSIYYCVFECLSREQCLKAFELISGHGRDQLKQWQPPHYAVTIEGPDFYSSKGTTTKRLKSHPWKLSQIRNGLYYERAQDDQRFLEYYAIDLASNRIYFHQQIGGFPTTEYIPPATSR
jgi:hypothetical protein